MTVLFKRVHADGHVADHVFVDLRLALKLCDDASRRIDFEHDII